MEEEVKEITQEDQKKKQQFEEIYKKHEEEISHQKIEKSEKLKQKNPRELAITILNEFTEKYNEIMAQIDNYTETSQIDNIFELYTNLQKYYIEQNYAMNNYDKQQYKEQLDNIDKKIQELREKIKPRKKFAFSKKTNAYQSQQLQEKIPKIVDNQDLSKEAISTLQGEGVENLEGQTIIMEESQVKPSIKISNNKNSIIKINALLDCVYLENNDNCKIFIGPTKFSIMLTNITNCEVSIMSHQIRIHDSKNTIFYIFSSSKSIIENCSELKFKKYNYSYDQLEEHLKVINLSSKFQKISGLHGKDNLWKEIQDFNWHKQERSPNFEIIE